MPEEERRYCSQQDAVSRVVGAIYRCPAKRRYAGKMNRYQILPEFEGTHDGSKDPDAPVPDE